MLYAKAIKEFSRLRRDLVKGRIGVDELKRSKIYFDDFAQGIIKLEAQGLPVSDDLAKGVEDFLMLCLDSYAYSTDGSVLVDDHTYDTIMRIWRDWGNDYIAHADPIQASSMWGFRRHEAPFMVGTISKKLYTPDELEAALENAQVHGYRYLRYAPKFDGVSVSIKWLYGRIVYAVTRYDGVEGQDITQVIQVMNDAKHIFTGEMPDGYYKCEIAVSTEDFNALQEVKPYANRRSAASAIISTPNNAELGIYLTVIPLAWVNLEKTQMRYIAAEYLNGVLDYNPKEMRMAVVLENIEQILHHIRQPSYPFRVDGVVLFPMHDENDLPNVEDLMADCFAYKINTQEAITHVQDVYMSVGRTGQGTPMAHVEACDLNETVCTEVTLGSMDIFSGLGLRKGEEVIVYAAGDIIPQLRRPDIRKYPRGAAVLPMNIRCPYCKSVMRFKQGSTANIYCLNPECPRVVSGKIVNFLEKLDACEGIRDETIMRICDAHIIRTIRDLFYLESKRRQLVKCIGPTNTDKFIDGIQEMTLKEYEVSQVIGACGIEDIAIRTCQAIFSEYTINYLLSLDTEKAYRRLMCLPGFGHKTVVKFVDWIDANRDFIQFLLTHMHIIDDAITYGNIVFTGFRNKDYVVPFKRIGFPVVESVNGDTVAVVYVGDLETGNGRKAKKKRLPLIHFSDIDQLLDILSEISDYIQKAPGTYDKDAIIRDIRHQLAG